jgi:hypothetical protein
MCRLRCLLAGGLVLAWPATLLADDAPHPLCRFILHDERTERDDLELEVGLARSELDAAEQIFLLLDDLWKNDAVERLLFSRGKHDRDVAALELERRRLLLERQVAIVEQYDLFCGAVFADRVTDEDRRAMDVAHRRYRKADCDALAVSVAIAASDLEFQREVLASVVDLRRNDVATRQDVILAERDVEMTEKRQEQAKRRVQRCRREVAELDGAEPE